MSSHPAPGFAAFLGWIAAGLLLGQAEARRLPCPPVASQACQPCHASDLAERFPARKDRPCSPYCQACHFKEHPEQHHPVGVLLKKNPPDPRLLASGNRLGCATCHDLATPRYDRVRWKAESLFDRMFRSQDQYPTFLLAIRNDRGQICLGCH